MDKQTKKALLAYFEQFLTDKRKNLFERVLKYRTRHIAVVLEDIYQSQNASAVLRSCDLTGVQDVHIIENKYPYDVNPDVAMGSAKWLNLIKYNAGENNTKDAYNALRKAGYRIVATSPHKRQYTPETLPLDQKVALVFGTELTGISEEGLAEADEFIRIPMHGFTESFNISVSAALLLYTLTGRLRNGEYNWHLSDNEITDLKLEWSRRSISRSEVIEDHFLKQFKSKGE
jgi:tRNA (guanosine-2'-O-)-methyltransferase